MYNILICDDEKDIVNALKIYLNNSDYCFYEAYNGQEAVNIVLEKDIHLVLMDIMMPVMDGIVALAKIRENSNVPVILLTAKGEDSDKVLGLDIGADDYITKPFVPVEVAARVRSALRRFTRLGGGVKAGTLKIGGIELDDYSKAVTVDGESVSLTPKEYEILRLLMGLPGKVFSPKEIYREVWKESPFESDNTVAVHVRHLREKVEINPSEPRYIKVIFGQGYKIESVK
ncbi:MAG: response regulator transcription factor [Lachnospiraceae bacterium]|nr:response regulator transcription factor [Lachnospiraceae bacterium]